MQWRGRGSTNKSPTKMNAAKIKFDMVICLRMEKTIPSDLSNKHEVCFMLKSAF